MRTRRFASPPIAVLVVAAAVVAVLVGSPAASAKTAANPAWLVKAEKQVAAAYKGQQMAVARGPKAQKGKTVWEVACLLAIPDCAQANSGVKAAAKALGWKLTVVDGKNDPTLTATYIQRAMAAKAAGIISVGIDCPAIKNALVAAQSAKVPVVTIGGLDCPGKPLFTASSKIGGLPFLKGETNIYDKNRLSWGIVQTQGKMSLIDVNITNLAAVSVQNTAMLKYLKQCPTCKVVDTINLDITNLPQIAQLLPASLQKHPEANAIWLFNGSALTLGAKTAIEQAGRQKDMVVMSGTCTNGEPALMRAGWKIGCDAFSLVWNGWQAADTLNRIFAGQTAAQIPKVGVGLQMIDAKHNLPKGSTWTPPFDYAAAYKKLWKTGK